MQPRARSCFVVFFAVILLLMLILPSTPISPFRSEPQVVVDIQTRPAAVKFHQTTVSIHESSLPEPKLHREEAQQPEQQVAIQEPKPEPVEQPKPKPQPEPKPQPKPEPKVQQQADEVVATELKPPKGKKYKPAERLESFTPTKDEITFLTIGDFGKTAKESPKKQVLADVMAKWAEKLNIDFVVSTGDNFYPEGAKGPNDPQFKEKFEKPFHHDALQVRWFMSLGNHDYLPHKTADIRGQVAYTKVSDRWYLPSPYYTSVVKGKGFSVEVFVFDQYDPKEYDSINTKNPYPVQLPWLKKQLEASTADWKLVICHRPILSSGWWHGTYPKWAKAINPVMDPNGVQAYFTGDDHILEVLKEPRSGIVHFVSGAGSHMHKFKHLEKKAIYRYNEELGFTAHVVNRTHMKSMLINCKDEVLFTYVQPVKNMLG